MRKLDAIQDRADLTAHAMIEDDTDGRPHGYEVRPAAPTHERELAALLCHLDSIGCAYPTPGSNAAPNQLPRHSGRHDDVSAVLAFSPCPAA